MRIELVDALAPHTVEDDGALSLPAFVTRRGEAIGAGGCAGLSVAIYDPDRDPDGSCAAATVDLVRETIRAHR